MRRRRNRATWFPILGFENALNNFVTVDARELSVRNDGLTNVTVVPIIPDIDANVSESQTGAGGVVRTLRDYVEGQSCIIERIVGNIQVAGPKVDLGEAGRISAYAVCAAIAVLPTTDDGTGDPAIVTQDLDPLNANNSAQPWLWRRVWCLGGIANSNQVGSNSGLPQSNTFGSYQEGSKVDTKGVKRAIRREQRIFLIYSTCALFPDNEATGLLNEVIVTADLRVIGKMVRAKNRSSFK